MAHHASAFHMFLDSRRSGEEAQSNRSNSVDSQICFRGFVRRIDHSQMVSDMIAVPLARSNNQLFLQPNFFSRMFILIVSMAL